MKTFEIALTFVGPRSQMRLVLKEDAATKKEAESKALKRGRAITGRRMRVSKRCE